MQRSTKAFVLTAASASLAFAVSPVTAGDNAGQKKDSPYFAGDMHNHNTCTDGSVAAGYTIDRAVGKGAPAGVANFDLDWFTLGNHGGSGVRDCRFSDTSAKLPGDVTTYWPETLGQTIQGITITSLQGTPATNVKADNTTQTPVMWRWQSIKEIEYPIVVNRTAQYNKVLVEGLEWVVPGHEHADVAVIAGQHPRNGGGNADKMAEFEFRFDRGDLDKIGPVDSSNQQVWPGKDLDFTHNSGTDGHKKAVSAVEWLQKNYPLQSYAIPTHTERQGPFSATGTKGYDIEHFRDFNNAGPTVAFGIESPGHMAEGGLSGGSGSYGASAVGGGTYGMVGVYHAKIGGLWDGLLGEGRNMFMFISSDWHNRGAFGARDAATTADFIPGEYS
jgi:hypothetical protein